MLKADDARSTGAVHVPPAAGAPLPAAPAIPSCRDLVRAIGTLARDVGPDAALLADIAELAEMSRRHDTLYKETDGLDLDDPGCQMIWRILGGESGRYHELREAIARCPAATLEGAWAKAALAHDLLAPLYADEPADWDCGEALAYSALADLLARAGA